MRIIKFRRPAFRRWMLQWASLFFAVTSGADVFQKPGLGSEVLAVVAKIEPVLRKVDSAGRERLVPVGGDAAGPHAGTEIAFRAVRASLWPDGLVPLFEVSREGSFELSRLPAADAENSSEPLFFALPAEGEAAAQRLCGSWTFRAIRNESTSLTTLEMTVFEGRVSARFDQNTDYGFASFNRGTFENNRLSLVARYIADAYELQALWEEGVLRGNWRDLGDSERGTWEAVRRKGPLVSETGAVPLFEWIRKSDGAKRYAVEGTALGHEWQQAERVMCRVWR